MFLKIEKREEQETHMFWNAFECTGTQENYKRVSDFCKNKN